MKLTTSNQPYPQFSNTTWQFLSIIRWEGHNLAMMGKWCYKQCLWKSDYRCDVATRVREDRIVSKAKGIWIRIPNRESVSKFAIHSDMLISPSAITVNVEAIFLRMIMMHDAVWQEDECDMVSILPMSLGPRCDLFDEISTSKLCLCMFTWLNIV